MTVQFDYWLSKRVALGDRYAFETLIGQHEGKLRNIAQEFTRAGDTELDDQLQIMRQRLWAEVERGRWNAHVDFRVFAVKIGRQALIDDHRYRRAAKRWDELGPPASLDMLHDPDPESDASPYVAPSSWQFVDPLQVILQRETLREAWQALTAGQQVAVNAYLKHDGIGAPGAMVTAMAEARKRTRPLRLL